jgi:hypothetical protein
MKRLNETLDEIELNGCPQFSSTVTPDQARQHALKILGDCESDEEFATYAKWCVAIDKAIDEWCAGQTEIRRTRNLKTCVAGAGS